jgi:hypothetical protein
MYEIVKKCEAGVATIDEREIQAESGISLRKTQRIQEEISDFPAEGRDKGGCEGKIIANRRQGSGCETKRPRTGVMRGAGPIVRACGLEVRLEADIP